MPRLENLGKRLRELNDDTVRLPRKAPDPEPVSDDLKAEIAELKRRVARLERGPVRYGGAS